MYVFHSPVLQDGKSHPPLIRATGLGNYDAVTILVSHGADVNARNDAGVCASLISKVNVEVLSV